MPLTSKHPLLIDSLENYFSWMPTVASELKLRFVR